MANLKTVTLTEKSKGLHIEAQGCIINIRPGLHDADGRDVTSIEIIADGDRYAGQEAWLEGSAGNQHTNIRVVRKTE